MDTEDELANILGHEIEHADLGHCAGRGSRARPASCRWATSRNSSRMFEAGYSKDQELEPDREGAKLAESAGYSAEGAISMFRKFQKLKYEFISIVRVARSSTPCSRCPLNLAMS